MARSLSGFVTLLNVGRVKESEALEVYPPRFQGNRQAYAYLEGLAYHAAVKQMAPVGAPLRPDSLPPDSFRTLLPFKLYLEFTEGADCTESLEALVASLETQCLWSDLDPWLIATSVAVFMGRRDILDRLRGFEKKFFDRPSGVVRKEDTKDNAVCMNWLKGCLRLLNGKLDMTTVRSLAHILQTDDLYADRWSYRRGYGSTFLKGNGISHLRLPGMGLLAFAVSVLYAKGDAGLRQSYLNAHYNEVKQEALSVDSPEVAEVTNLFKKTHLVLAIDPHYWEGEKDPFAPSGTTPFAFFVSASGQFMAAWRTARIVQTILADGWRREKFQADDDVRVRFRVYLDAAARAFRAKCIVLGATLTGLLRHWDEGGFIPAMQAAGRLPPDEGSALFLASKEPSRWELALRELQRIATKDDEGVSADEKIPFCWVLPLTPIKGWKKFYTVRNVKVMRCERIGLGTTFSDDIGMFANTIGQHQEKYNVRPEDEPVINLLRRFFFLESSSYYKDDLSGERMGRVLELLAGHPRVAILLSRREVQRKQKERAQDATLTFDELTIATARDDDGQLTLVAPAFYRSADARGLDPRTVVTYEQDADGRVVLKATRASPRTISALRLIDELGTDGKLVIPHADEVETQIQLCDMSQKIPMRGLFGEGADISRLPHLAVDPTPHLRLCLEMDDTLTVTLKILLESGTRPILLDPGAGAAEMVLRHEGAPTVFTRDLGAEEERAEEMRAFIDGFTSIGAPGGDGWSIPNLEDTLAFLDALQARETPWPVDWTDAARMLETTTVKSVSLNDRHMSADQWFGLTGNVTLDDGLVLTFEDMLRALPNRAGRFVRLAGGRFVKVSEALRRKLDFLRAAGRVRKDDIDIPLAAIPALDAVFAKDEGDKADEEAPGTRLKLPSEIVARAKEIRSALRRKVSVPESFAATLRPYQTDGFVWLSRLADCRIGACLADDMGLGKTLEVIAVLLARAGDGASIVIAPTSVCPNWVRETRRFAPGLNPRLLNGDVDEAELARDAGAGDVVITSYGLVVTRGEALFARTWNGVVLDEAQAIKNDETKRFRAVRHLRGNFRIAATGTPVENRMADFWSIFEFLNPGMLFAKSEFLTRYTANGKATAELKKLIAPLVLRRLKKDVLKELPPKTEINLDVELSVPERSAYEACRQSALRAVERASKAGGGGAGMVVLRELTRLRRFCCHPSLVYPTYHESSKLDALAELLSDLKGGEHKALVFSQFTDYLAIVRRMVEEKGWTYQYLDGTTSPAARAKAVEAFQSGEGDFFLISLKAGGFGLTLTEASYVILLDPWWNPAVENQAADRVHRIGQRNPVTVYRLVAKDTIEERVINLHAEKLAMAEDLLEGTGSTSLSTADMIKLFR